MRQAVILAGGKGTRLAQRLGTLPKPLIDVAGLPLLERQIDALTSYGFHEILILAGIGRTHIEEYVAKRVNGPNIQVVADGPPRGTAGALLAAFNLLSDKFLVIYGDTLFNLDLSRLWNFHLKSGCDISLVLHPNEHPADSDLVETDDACRAVAFHGYPHPVGSFYRNQVNAAMYVMERKALASWLGFRQPSDLMKDLFPEMLRGGTSFYGYRTFEYIKDIGTPDRLDLATSHLRTGRIDRASRVVKQAAVFLDRDGTLNRQRDYVRVAEDLVLFPRVASAINLLHEHEFRTIVLTNQPVLARGECSVEELRRIHGRLDMELAKEGAFLDDILYCPHHPDSGFDGEVPELKIKCDCRKPNIGMVLEASERFNVDLSRSWMVGDSNSDMIAAKRAGVRSIFVRSGNLSVSGLETAPDHVVDGVFEAALLISSLSHGAIA